MALWHILAAMLRAESRSVALVVLASPLILLGQERWNQAMSQEIKKDWDSYAQAFITKDFNKMRDLLQVPFLQWNDREAASLASLDDVMKSYRGIRKALDA